MEASRPRRTITDEHKKKISEANKGRKMPPVSEETRAKLSAAHKGRKASDAQLAGIRAVAISRRGVPLPDEHKQKISDANKGRKMPPRSEETRRKLSEASKNRVHPPASEETRRKMSETRKGRPHPEQMIENIAARLAERLRAKPMPAMEARLHKYLEGVGLTDLQYQVQFGRYVCDFYSPSRHTAYEADGSHWHTSQEVGDRRDSYLRENFNHLKLIHFEG